MSVTHSVSENGWDESSERQLKVWMHTAQLNSAINELAALHYTKLYRIAVVVVSVLTIIVGSRGIATIVTAGISAGDIVISLCEIFLGIFASLLSNMELKTKSVSFGKRAIGYSKFASVLRVQLVLRPEERQHKLDLLQSIPEKVEYLDEMAEPLPLRYRELAIESPGGILNMWSRAANEQQTTSNPVADGTATVHPTSEFYDSNMDVEGTTAMIRTIIEQRL